MTNPAHVLPDAMTGIQNLYKAMSKGGVPQQTLELVHLRASQINGCSACVHAGVTNAKKAGETDERLFGPGGLDRDALLHRRRTRRAGTDRGRHPTVRPLRPGPRRDLGPAAKHYTEEELAALILMIATTNFFNRLNRTIKEPAGTTW
jgi:AhpD family alkylhydroperoxidase